MLGNEVAMGLIIIVTSLVSAKISEKILQKYLKTLTKKTESVTKPLGIGIVLLGIYLALKTSSYLTSYSVYIDGFFFTAFSLLIAMLLGRISSIGIDKWLKFQGKYRPIPKLINKIVKAVIYLIALLIILSYFGIEITPLVAGLGLGGLAIGLALQSTLSDFFAGIHILSDKPVRIGDWIELENGIAGYVEDIGWRSTKIRTLPNTIVIIPNSKLAESIITNYSLPEPETAVIVECGVSYESDLEKVEKVTIEVAKEIQKEVKGAIKNFEPFIRYKRFGDSNIIFSVILRAEKPVDKYLITHEFIKKLKKRYDKEGIEISWPIRKIYFGNKL